MHEFSIAKSLLELAERYAKESGAQRVLKVVVCIGPLSGVDPSLLRTAFNELKVETLAREAELVIETTGLKLFCFDCGKERERREIEFTCPVCGSRTTEITGGEELVLRGVELECADTSEDKA